MSLAPAPKDISAHPAKGSVVDPVDREKKEADVDRKIRLYGIISALRKGKLPTNAQLVKALSYVQKEIAPAGSSATTTGAGISPKPTTAATTTTTTTTTTTPSGTQRTAGPTTHPSNLGSLAGGPAPTISSEGRRLIQDLQRIIETTKNILGEKNSDELIQDFVWRTSKEVDTNGLVQGTKEGVLGDLDERLGEGKVEGDKDLAIKHLRTILSLILTNSEIRKLLSDFSLIGRDLFSISASNLASSIAPHPDQLATVDEPAPDNEFITEGGRKTQNTNETPVLEARVPGTQQVIRNDPNEPDAAFVNTADGQRREARDIVGQGKEAAGEYRERGGAGGIAVDAAREHGPGMVQQGKQVVREQVGDVQDAENPDAAVDEKKRGVMDRMRGVRDTINDRIPQKHKDLAKNKTDRTREFLSEEYFPEERRERFLFRGKKVILECQKHDDYQQSMTWLLDALKEYAGHGRNAAGSVGEHGTKNVEYSNLKYCIAALRTILERFANGQSMDVITDAIDALADDANRDRALREWFEAGELYLRKVLLEPGYVLEPECNQHGNRLRELGREFYDVKYKSHFDNLFGSVSTWFGGLGEDPLNRQFGEDWARLTKDLVFDSEGSLKFKPELWDDIRKVILPKLIDQAGYIPIPRIEYSDDALDLVVENLTLQGRNLFPNIVELEANNYVKFSPYGAINDDSRHRIKLSLEQMQADMRDVAFYYRKKTGIPKMKDSGLADVLLGGQGLSATIELISSKHDPSSIFKVHSVHVKVDTLKFSIRDSNHDFLYKTLRPLATGLIKKQIEKAIRDALVTACEYLDGQLIGVRDRMESAKKSEDGNRVEVLKDIFNQKKSDAASVGRSVDSKASQFKIVGDKRSSILSEQGHPSGWVNKVEKRQEMRESGKEWRSDAFEVV